ncbi:putative testis-expressed protein 13C [Talpa occidentalis]|uniref:putative testis-expressed protein 13C n=1 Tax=Talpa occidentalis TaxID=50954 RepID=UPI0018900076|nr:putative testis-expressed protein 13C [Talpa occidentalis]
MAVEYGDQASGFRHVEVIRFINNEVLMNGGGPDFYQAFRSRPWNEIEDRLRAAVVNPQVPRTLKRSCAWSALALSVRVGARQREQQACRIQQLQQQVEELQATSWALATELQWLREERQDMAARLRFLRATLQQVLNERNVLYWRLLQAERLAHANPQLQLVMPEQGVEQFKAAAWPPTVEEQGKMVALGPHGVPQHADSQMAASPNVLYMPRPQGPWAQAGPSSLQMPVPPPFPFQAPFPGVPYSTPLPSGVMESEGAAAAAPSPQMPPLGMYPLSLCAPVSSQGMALQYDEGAYGQEKYSENLQACSSGQEKYSENLQEACSYSQEKYSENLQEACSYTQEKYSENLQEACSYSHEKYSENLQEACSYTQEKYSENLQEACSCSHEKYSENLQEACSYSQEKYSENLQEACSYSHEKYSENLQEACSYSHEKYSENLQEACSYSHEKYSENLQEACSLEGSSFYQEEGCVCPPGVEDTKNHTEEDQPKLQGTDLPGGSRSQSQKKCPVMPQERNPLGNSKSHRQEEGPKKPQEISPQEGSKSPDERKSPKQQRSPGQKAKQPKVKKAPDSQPGEKPATDGHPVDWGCPWCKAWNFSWRKACYKCKKTYTAAESGELGPGQPL